MRLLAKILTVNLLLSCAYSQSRAMESLITDPRGLEEVIVCSQNLENYGTFKQVRARSPGKTAEDVKRKTSELVSRMIKAKCDVIAVQEILGEKKEDAELAIQQIAQELRFQSNRFFDYIIGDAVEGPLRVGFLVAKDRASIESSLSYIKVELPTLASQQKPRVFPRPPLEIQILVKPKGESVARTVVLVNMHLKSKAGGKNDPTGLAWETARMEMAEGLRRIIELRMKQSLASAEIPLIILGDRNSDFDSATARILEGSLSLKEFQGEAPCRLSKNGVPLCQPGYQKAQKFFSVLSLDPEVRGTGGTFTFKGDKSWLDEILLPQSSLPHAWSQFDREGNYNSGIVAEPEDASDHALVWVGLNW